MKRKEKNIGVSILAVAMLASLTACGSSSVTSASVGSTSGSTFETSTSVASNTVETNTASGLAASSSDSAASAPASNASGGGSKDVASTSIEITDVPGTDDTSLLSEDYTASKKYKIGFALESMDVEVWNTMSKGMEDEAAKIGVDYTCMVANNDVATQVSNIENMITQGFDAIIIHSFDKEAFATVVNEAIDKGITICAYDDNIIDPATGEPCKYPLSFLCDNYQIGYRVGTMAAEWTKKQFPDETGDLEFGVLWHHEFEYQQARLVGIKDAIAEKDPRIKLVDEQEGLVTEDGVKACEAWTQAFPNLKGVLATNDTCLLGYAQAWQAAGKDLKDENFGMFGNDGVNDAMDMVSEGTIMRGDVGLNVYDGGAMALLQCVRCMDGQDYDSVILPMVSCTVDNVEKDWISHPTMYVES